MRKAVFIMHRIHLAAKTVFDRMTLQKRHGEASQPAQFVAQRAFTGATVVFSEVHIQHTQCIDSMPQ